MNYYTLPKIDRDARMQSAMIAWKPVQSASLLIVFTPLCDIVYVNGGAKMNRLLATVLLFTVTFVISAAASAEVLRGRVKAIDPDSAIFSLMTGRDNVVTVSWDSRTSWQGISGFADMKPDENLSVDSQMIGDSAVAKAVTRLNTPLPKGVALVSLESLTGEGGGSFTLVDTRATELYDAGHIPGALSLPLARLEKSKSGLLPEDKSVRIVFYDEGQGGNSAGRGAEIAMSCGYSAVAIFAEGVSGWESSGRILAASTAYIRKVRPVVLDIRPNEQVAEGHIEGAVNYPAPMLKEYYRRLPLEKLAPIVVYGASDKEAVTAAKTIKELGFRRVRIYPGGASAWAGNAEALRTGPALEEIQSSAQTHGGKLSTRDFEMALQSPVMVEIIDVRSEDDQKKGVLPRSKRIPLKSLAKRHGELDRDKIQVIFAADALRAEMAYDFLKSKGYRVNYLNGLVEFEKEDKYKLREN